MSLERQPGVDEHILRRALRLDADEVPARLDPALLAAAARASSLPARQVAIACAVAFVAGWVWSEAVRALLAVLSIGFDPIGAAVELVTTVAPRLVPLVETAMHPAVPIAILATAVVAVLFEHRGRSHVASS
jgi:hypothetical protein